MTIAVTGATGQLGRLAIAALKAHVPAAEIVALVRDPAKAADLGVAVRVADYDRPETLGPALAGVDRLLFISSSEVGKRAVQHKAVIAAAKAAGVGLIAYTSILHADRSPIGLAEEHRETEAALAGSGVPFVLLRHGWYSENFTGRIAPALAAGGLIGSAGDGRISTAPRRDFAAAAAAVIAGDGHAGQVYELAGDEAFTLASFAATVGRQAGRELPYRDVPEADFAAVLEGAGLPAPVAAMIAHWDVDAANAALFDDSRTLSRLTGRPTAPIAEDIALALTALSAAAPVA